jgi:cytochrome c
LLEGKPVGSDQYVVEEVSSSNWDPPAREGLGADEEELLVGEVDMEDDAFIEEDPDEVPTPPPVPWRLMARYVGQISPSAETLKVHFTKVWMLRRGATFAPIKPKWFIITLNSEGDYNFVVNGGPWVHLGNALLVQPLKGDERPSATDLTSMPIWVKMYDVPWDKQNEANGRKWGSRLGRVVEVDADKSTYRDFLRVRIEIPINKRLETHITTGVKDRPETHSTYILRYERVPYFCFWCGFIGHNDTVCEKKRRGIPSLGYDSNLRCAPMRKYEYRQAHAPPAVQPMAKKGLDFSSSGDNSETLGVPKVRTRRQVPGRREDVG